MEDVDKYVDWKGTPIVVGSVVIVDTAPEDASGTAPGRVVRIDYPDYDYSDELERAVQFGPYIWVQWPEFEEGDTERFTGFTPNSWEDPNLHQFDDLTVVV